MIVRALPKPWSSRTSLLTRWRSLENKFDLLHSFGALAPDGQAGAGRPGGLPKGAHAPPPITRKGVLKGMLVVPLYLCLVGTK